MHKRSIPGHSIAVRSLVSKILNTQVDSKRYGRGQANQKRKLMERRKTINIAGLVDLVQVTAALLVDEKPCKGYHSHQKSNSHSGHGADEQTIGIAG
jgi:hypothetical protein